MTNQSTLRTNDMMTETGWFKLSDQKPSIGEVCLVCVDTSPNETRGLHPRQWEIHILEWTTESAYSFGFDIDYSDINYLRDWYGQDYAEGIDGIENLYWKSAPMWPTLKGYQPKL